MSGMNTVSRRRSLIPDHPFERNSQHRGFNFVGLRATIREAARLAADRERDEPPGSGAALWRIEGQPIRARIIRAFWYFAAWATWHPARDPRRPGWPTAQ
jgi:hypothetical protein